jgi:hypothetical protein
MAQTDARAGFRLPWSSERSNIEQTETDQVDAPAAEVSGGWPETDTAPAQDPWGMAPQDTATDNATWGTDAPAADAPADVPAGDVEVETTAAPESAKSPTSKRPSKFLADLTKAMQTAAEEQRNTTLGQFQADAKVHVDKIHERSATEANALRRQADDDVAAVREWSKAEIARIREETETRITARKGRLETEIEQHGVMIERQIELVQGRVTAFEEEMAQFFERLLGEDDPTHFATMAENLPEPPSFDDMPVLDPVEFAAQLEYEAAIAEPVATDEVEVDASADTATETVDGETAQGEAETEMVGEADPSDETVGELTTEAEWTETSGELEAVVETDPETDTVEAETIGEAEGESATADAELGTTEGGWNADGQPAGEFDPNAEFPNGEVPEGFEIDREAAFAAIQAAAEAAASAEVATDAAARAEAVADIAIEIVGSHDEEDARVNALGLTPDFDAAEAEVATEGEGVTEIGDDQLAARLAGLVPGKGGKAQSTDVKSTQVVVVGLVSVASIASFKRHLGRLSGVQSVGVSSGPDGEFLFAVNHAADAALRDLIPGLPSFQARVTGSSEGVINVTAHDPESDS